MNPKNISKYVEPSASFEAIEKLQDAGYLINRVSAGASSYKILLYKNKNDWLAVQNGTQLFMGTWDEVKAFLFGMSCVVELEQG